MSVKRTYYVYWCTVVFKDGTRRTVKFSGHSNYAVQEKMAKINVRFADIISSFVISKDEYQQVG